MRADSCLSAGRLNTPIAQAGFSLIELMVTVTLSAILIPVLVNTFSVLYKSMLINNKKVHLEQSLHFARLVLKEDIQNAGVFASFSFHNQSGEHAAIYESVNETAGLNGACGDKDWCTFDLMGVGIKSYNRGTMIKGSKIQAKSDIIRIQTGGRHKAYFKSAVMNDAYMSDLFFSVPDGNAIIAKTYMLASSNHVYLLNFIANKANNRVSGINIPIKLLGSKIIYDPDEATLILLPFITKYYFVNAAGLQVVTYDGSILSDPEVISKEVTGVAISYKLDYIPTTNFNHYGINSNAYIWCTTQAMNDINNQFCYNRWSQVSLVDITLNAVSPQNTLPNHISLHLALPGQVVHEVVGWRW